MIKIGTLCLVHSAPGHQCREVEGRVCTVTGYCRYGLHGCGVMAVTVNIPLPEPYTSICQRCLVPLAPPPDPEMIGHIDEILRSLSA